MSIVGRTYLERGEPVVVLAQWRTRKAVAERVVEGDSKAFITATKVHPQIANRKSGPRNVLIRRANGDRVVRPFRGLRRTEEVTSE